MDFLVNNSPFAGKEGKFVTSRQLRDRLYKELERNVALRVADHGFPTTSWTVSGRGELHLSIQSLAHLTRRDELPVATREGRVVHEKINPRSSFLRPRFPRGHLRAPTFVTVRPISTPSSGVSATISPVAEISPPRPAPILRSRTGLVARFRWRWFGRIERKERHGISDVHRAALDAPDSEAPEIRRVIDRRDEHLKRARLVAGRLRKMSHNGLE